MPLEREGREYLNATEAAEFFGVSFVTFQTIRKDYNLQSRRFVGQGRQVFFLKEDLERIKNQPLEEAR